MKENHIWQHNFKKLPKMSGVECTEKILGILVNYYRKYAMIHTIGAYIFAPVLFFVTIKPADMILNI